MKADYPPDSKEAAVVRSIETFGRFLTQGDLASWAGYWAEDGVLMPPGHPRVIGRANIEAYVRGHFGNAETMDLSNWDIHIEGDLAVVTTDVTWRTSAGGEGTLKQLMVLRRASDDRWVRQKVIYNSD